MARIDEIAPDLYRVSIYLPQIDLQFNHVLTKDDEPLLFHTGMQRMFPEVRDAIAKLIDLMNIKRKAGGFRNAQNFTTAIYFHCGGLDLYPR